MIAAGAGPQHRHPDGAIGRNPLMRPGGGRGRLRGPGPRAVAAGGRRRRVVRRRPGRVHGGPAAHARRDRCPAATSRGTMAGEHPSTPRGPRRAGSALRRRLSRPPTSATTRARPAPPRGLRRRRPARRRANGKLALRWTSAASAHRSSAPTSRCGSTGDDARAPTGHGQRRTRHPAAGGRLRARRPPDLAWAEGFDVPPGDLDEPSPSTAGAAFLGDWFGFAYSVLEQLRARRGRQTPAGSSSGPSTSTPPFDWAAERPAGHVRRAHRATRGTRALPLRRCPRQFEAWRRASSGTPAPSGRRPPAARVRRRRRPARRGPRRSSGRRATPCGLRSAPTLPRAGRPGRSTPSSTATRPRPTGRAGGAAQHDRQHRRRHRTSAGRSGGLGGPADKRVFLILRSLADGSSSGPEPSAPRARARALAKESGRATNGGSERCLPSPSSPGRACSTGRRRSSPRPPRGRSSSRWPTRRPTTGTGPPRWPTS